MVKLTVELIEQAAQYTNPVRDRELDLRGYKIPVIENLGATLDQYDTIEFSDNDLRKLDGFPLLRRLKCLILNNNRVTRIAEHLEQNLPNLDTVILTNNNLQELGDIDPLSTVSTLQMLSLVRNPLTSKKYYRLYVIHKLPQLKVLDFQKVKQKERDACAALFTGKKGQQLARDIGKRFKTFVPGTPIAGATAPAAEAQQNPAAAAAAAATAAAAKQNIDAIKAAIAKATTLEEVERLSRLLQSGQIPQEDGVGRPAQNGSSVPAAPREEEDMEP